MTPRKVLIVLFDNLGDTVMATSVIRPLRLAFPGVEVGLWIKSYAAGIFASTKLVEHVHAADPFWGRSPGQPSGRFGDFIRVWREVRAEEYDAALVLNAEWRRALACEAAGIRTRVGLNRRKSSFFLTAPLDVQPGHHFTTDHRRLVEQWSRHLIDADAALPVLDLSEDDSRAAAEWLLSAGWSQSSLVVIHPFSGDERKNWNLANWALVIRTLAEKNSRLRFVLTCSAAEKARLADVMGELAALPIRVLGGAPLGLLKGLLARATVFAGGDSGPGHVAAALGTPVISLFGPTDPARCRPIGRKPVRILRGDSVDQIKIATVMGEMEGLIQKEAPRVAR